MSDNQSDNSDYWLPKPADMSTDMDLPDPIGYATANGLRMLRQDDATVLLYRHEYLIRPDATALFTADQMRAVIAERDIYKDSCEAKADRIDRLGEHVEALRAQVESLKRRLDDCDGG